MKYRLPILLERTVRDTEAARRELAAKVDRELRSMEGSALTCETGCHHCCYHPVQITLFEAITLFRWLAENMLWNTQLKERFVEAARMTLGLRWEVWLLSMIPCPLLDLDKGLCQAYEKRPFICKTTVSVRDPHYCHPHRLGADTGLVAHKEMMLRLREVEEPARKRHEIGKLLLPLAKAVLMAEQICKKEIDFEDSGIRIWLDLKENG